ncbi:P1 family peptidase [Rhodospirillaceae bacterium SYSU D60014]|uniref:DmpA family aminopeptidase n=1 Tax=Virgifigura deserti TaxID=2268457 RepID=UPI000E66A3C7
MQRTRARDLGLDFAGRPGPHNALTDVPGVLVGYSTLIEGDGELVVGKGPVRTGVTAILPRGRQRELMPIWAGVHALNGNGEMTGVHWIRDAGHFLSPICITNTHSVGIVHHAVTRWMMDSHPAEFRDEHLWALPVVAETYDGVLNDINGQHVTEAHVYDALGAAAGGAIAEGNVGGGTGMICYEYKGGTGTASRRITVGGEDYTVGALVQANHGIRDWLTILGVPVGRYLRDDRLLDTERGSIIVVIGTDAPMLPHQLRRLAERASIGIGRNGTPGGNSSGDIFLAFSVANPMSRQQMAAPRSTLEYVADNCFDPIYLAAVEATEEAVINALVAAEDMSTVKPRGKVCRAIDHDALRDIMSRHGRIK